MSCKIPQCWVFVSLGSSPSTSQHRLGELRACCRLTMGACIGVKLCFLVWKVTLMTRKSWVMTVEKALLMSTELWSNFHMVQ